MVGIRNLMGKDACWISRLKDELVDEGTASELLAANLSSLFLSSLISSCTGENVGTSFFLEDADVHLASKWAQNLLQHYDQAGRTHCVTTLVPLQPILSLENSNMLQTSVEGSIRLHCEVWIV